MRAFWTIFRREFSAYFQSPIAAVFLIVFALFINGVFMLQFFQLGKADMRPFFLFLPYALNIFIPAIAMRLWAEDRKGNTFELLMTFPMRSWELVLGKYVAGLAFYLLALTMTLTVPVMLSWAGRADAGVVIGGYLGAVSVGALFLAMGIFLSGLCRDQIVAFILSVLASFALFFIGTDAFAAAADAWAPPLGSFLRDSVGMASHLVSFGKGVIDVGDILYFVIGTAAFLFLNGLSLEGRFQPKARLIFSGAVFLTLASVVLANALTQDLALGRFDWTEERYYTISESSQKILKNLPVSAQVKYYVSPPEGLPTTLKTLEREVTDKLEELKVTAGGKLNYRVIHLDTGIDDPALQEKLRNEGVSPFQVESIQRDEVGVKRIYSSIVIEYKEKPQEIIPRVIPQTLYDFEYQLVSRIHKLTLEEKPKIAVFAPVRGQSIPEETQRALAETDTDEQSFEDPYKTATVLMRNNGYDVSRIRLSKDSVIPKETRALLVLDPGELTDRQRYEINRYLHAGGTVVLAAQGYEYTFKAGPQSLEAIPEKRPLNINRLIERWGVRINEDILLDESSRVISLESGQRVGPFAVQMPVNFPNQIVVRESSIRREPSITQRIPAVFYLWGSALDVTESAVEASGLKNTVLFTSSPHTWTIPNAGALTIENTRPPKEFKGDRVLALLLEGQFSDTFGTSAPVWSAGETPETTRMENPKPGRLLVLGCSQAWKEDLLQNPGNLNLFANVIDGLVLGDDLVRIRSKAPVLRDLRPLLASEKLAYKFFTVFFLPLLVFLAAIIWRVVRRKEKEFYLAALRTVSG